MKDEAERFPWESSGMVLGGMLEWALRGVRVYQEKDSVLGWGGAKRRRIF